MNAKDQTKLLDAGFKIFRRDYLRMRISAKTQDWQDWHVFAKGFKTKVQIDAMMKELLKERNNVED